METKKFKVDDLIENLSKEEKDYVFNYIKFKVENLVKFKGYNMDLHSYYNLFKEETGKNIELIESDPVTNAITVDGDSDTIRYTTELNKSEKLLAALAITLSYFKEAVNKVSKVKYDSVTLEDFLKRRNLTAYERRIMHNALNIIVPVDEIAITMHNDFLIIKEAHSYGEKELYCLRKLYKDKIKNTYKLPNEMMEVVFDYVSFEYFAKNGFKEDEVSQMLDKRYRYIDKDKEKEIKKRNLGA